MAIAPKPDMRPGNANFSSGPCAKRPGFTWMRCPARCWAAAIAPAEPKARLAEVIERSRAMLGMPADWRLGIVPASDTGAIEMALWSLLGRARRRYAGVREFRRRLGHRRGRSSFDCPMRACCRRRTGSCPTSPRWISAHDVVFPWNGTTSGVRVPNGDWIAADRQGLAICDATSAAFAMRAAVGQARCRDLVLAEGAGRRGGARHAGAVAARGGAAGNLQAGLAAAEDLPPDVRRQADRGHLQGRDDQHAVDAVRRGRAGRAALGGAGRRAGGADRASRGQSGRGRALGGADRVGGFPRRGSRRRVRARRSA